MLFLIKLIRKVFRQIKSDLTPLQIGIGVFLGVLLGMTPAGLHWIPLFALAILFNCSMGAVLLCWGTFKLFFLLIAGTVFDLGFNLLAGGPGFWTSIAQMLSEAPFLAWLGYERYIVFGAYVAGLPFALIIAALATFCVRGYREKVAGRLAEASWYQKIQKVGLLRFAWNFFFGKDVETGEKKKRMLLLRPFRAYMVVAVPLLVIGLTVGGGLWAQWFIDDLAAGAASRALGVKCTFGDVSYAFFGQELGFTQFQLPDPSDTSQDMIRVGAFEADLGFTALLSKRFHIEKLAVRDVSFSVARKEDGALNITELGEPDAQTPPGERAAWEEFVQWLYDKGKDVDWTELWKKYMEYREKLAKEKAEEAEAPPAPDYDPDLRWRPTRTAPLVQVDSIEVENLQVTLSDRANAESAIPSLTSVSAKGTQISTMPGWNGQPLSLAGTGSLDGGKSGEIKFVFSHLPGKTDANFSIGGVPLVGLKPLYEKSLPVNIEKGLVSVSTEGAMVDGTLDSSVNLRIDELRVASKPGSPGILGLDPQTSQYAIQGINAYGEKLPVVVGVGIVGPAGDPEVQGTVPFLEIAKKGLEMLGKKELQKYIDRIGGEVASIKEKGLEKVVPLKEGFKDVQAESVKALQTGNFEGVKDALKKGKTDAKSVGDVKDLKKDLEKKKDSVKDVLDLFKKKKD